jgi:hypothetical protein
LDGTLGGGREAANEISDILIRVENELAHPASETLSRCEAIHNECRGRDIHCGWLVLNYFRLDDSAGSGYLNSSGLFFDWLLLGRWCGQEGLGFEGEQNDQRQ